jgi:DNA primase catalytic subunit
MASATSCMLFPQTVLKGTKRDYFTSKNTKDMLFPYDLFYRIFVRSSKTEIAFVFTDEHGKEGYKRYISATSGEDLRKQYSSNPRYISMHIGSYFSNSNLREAVPVKRNLVFDIDLKDYSRPCSCDLKQVCDICWKFAEVAIEIISFVFHNFLGLKDEEVVFFFSGRKGFHCWVLNEDYFYDILPQRFKRAQTQNQGDTLPEGGITENILQLFDPKKSPHEIADAMADICRFTYDELKEDDKWIELFSNCVNKVTLKEDLFKLFLPKFDSNVTTGHNHLIKGPMVIHPGTGSVCCVIDKKKKIPMSYDKSVKKLEEILSQNSSLKKMQ